MNQPKDCPQCSNENIYYDGSLWVCSHCFHEWSYRDLSLSQQQGEEELQDLIRDANGVPLENGDTVSVIKDLKLNGSSSTIKSGTKVKNIRLVEGDEGHDIACKIDGFGSLYLKSQFVKKIKN